MTEITLRKQRHTHRVREKAPFILSDMATSLTVDGHKSETLAAIGPKGRRNDGNHVALRDPSPPISMLELESVTRRFAVSPFFPFASCPVPAATLRSGGEGAVMTQRPLRVATGAACKKGFTFISIYG